MPERVNYTTYVRQDVMLWENPMVEKPYLATTAKRRADVVARPRGRGRHFPGLFRRAR